MPNTEQVRDILREVKDLLTGTESDYSWSSWQDAEDATQEINGYLEDLINPSCAAVLFLPTGPLQELSLSSGWGDEFCALADRFDLAMACNCTQEHRLDLQFTSHLGPDSNFGEVALGECPGCGQLWLHYSYEDESVTASGRWYECWLTPFEGSSLNVDSALDILKSKPWHYYGGSYFSGKIGKSSGPVILS
ncbi:MAG: hypothetical protein K8R88_12775 [Armatimonadetes bacterium]|nr:hypothetical protein [Armatimonadota bacterium]